MTTTLTNDTLHVELRLKTVEHLFTEPDLSPFDPYYAPYSFAAGIDFLVGEMRRTPGAKRTELTVLLPADAVEPGLDARVREAIGRYAEAWANSSRQEREVEFLKSRRVLLIAVIFFAVANLVSLEFNHSGAIFGLSGLWVEVLVEGLSVVSWVALWWPLDQLIHATWQIRQDERAYRALRDIALRVQPDPLAPRAVHPGADS